jgi:MFS family permease
MSSSPAAVYAAEISHPNLRGRLTLLSALCTALGMLLVYLLGFLISVSASAANDVSLDYQSVNKDKITQILFNWRIIFPPRTTTAKSR